MVASEVKVLAGETGKATEEITAQIIQMQQQTDSAVAVISDISKMIETVSDSLRGSPRRLRSRRHNGGNQSQRSGSSDRDGRCNQQHHIGLARRADDRRRGGTGPDCHPVGVRTDQPINHIVKTSSEMSGPHKKRCGRMEGMGSLRMPRLSVTRERKGWGVVLRRWHDGTWRLPSWPRFWSRPGWRLVVNTGPGGGA